MGRGEESCDTLLVATKIWESFRENCALKQCEKANIIELQYKNRTQYSFESEYAKKYAIRVFGKYQVHKEAKSCSTQRSF